MNDPKKNLLYIGDVYKEYGQKLVLDNVDLSIREGELCTLVGPSGCGKSTLFRLILGEEQPTSGDILVDGRAAGFPDASRGIVYQKYSLYPNLTALDNVLLGKRLALWPWASYARREALRREGMAILERMHVQDHANNYPSALSGGQQQRVAIARALIMRPRILLMDEPFGALDPGAREYLQVFLLDLWQEMKMTILFVTHDLEEAVFLGTRVFILSQHYSDGRGATARRGSKIVFDQALPRALTTDVKRTAEFGELVSHIREDGFNPNHRRHVTEFNLRHQDSFQTLRDEELAK